MHSYFLRLRSRSWSVSCDKKEVSEPAPPVKDPLQYTGEKAVKVRKETLIELLAIKTGVKDTIAEHHKTQTLDGIVKELASYRSRLDYIRMQTQMLPKEERMVIYGNLAVATKQLEKDLLSILARAPGNDDLAVEIDNLRKKLSPIPLASILNKQKST